MKTHSRTLAVAVLMITILAGSLSAEETSVTFIDLNTRGVINLFLDGSSHGATYAAEFAVRIDGREASAFCVDMYHTIYPGPTYRANILALPDDPEWTSNE